MAGLLAASAKSVRWSTYSPSRSMTRAHRSAIPGRVAAHLHTARLTLFDEDLENRTWLATVFTDEDTPLSGNVFADNGSGADSDSDGTGSLNVTAAMGSWVQRGGDIDGEAASDWSGMRKLRI